jgi:hypothetical protein
MKQAVLTSTDRYFVRVALVPVGEMVPDYEGYLAMSSNDSDSLLDAATDLIDRLYTEDLNRPIRALRIVHSCHKDGQITEFMSCIFVGKNTVARDYTVNISVVERDDITH